jgi:HEAT repeat protein
VSLDSTRSLGPRSPLPLLIAAVVILCGTLAGSLTGGGPMGMTRAEAQPPEHGPPGAAMGPVSYDQWLSATESPSEDTRLKAVSQMLTRVREKGKAAKRLIDLIQHEKVARVRAAAVRALSGGPRAWQGVDASPIVIQALNDPDPDVRVAAATALHDYTGPEVQTALQRAAASHEPGVAIAASSALISTWAAAKEWGELIPFLGTREHDLGALSALQLQQSDRVPVPILIDTLAVEPRAPVREGICEVLATTCNGNSIYQERFAASTLSTSRLKEREAPPDLRAVEPMIQALHDPDDSVREMAAQGLGYFGDARAVKPLNDVLLHDPSVIVRRRAASALAVLPSEGALEGLSWAADEKTEKSRDVREYAVEALGWMESDAAVEPLIAALDDSDPDVRATAAKYLGQRRDKRAVPALLKALAEHEDIDAAGEAVKEHQADVDRLSAEMREPGATLGQIAAAAKGHAVAARLLQEASDSLAACYDVRWQAARSLGQIRDVSAKQGLIDAVTNPDQPAQVVQAARDALRKLGTLPPPTAFELKETRG